MAARLQRERLPRLLEWDSRRRFRGYTCHGDVTYVWEDATQRYQFVHFNSDDRDVFMVIVLDVARSRVMGHHLLDLKALYGILEA